MATEKGPPQRKVNAGALPSQQRQHPDEHDDTARRETATRLT